MRRWGFGPQTVRGHLVDFLGHEYERLQTHEKFFPEYDLASVNRALVSLLSECCADVRTVGGCGATTLGHLFEALRTPYSRNMRPTAIAYQRIPVDVEVEESFISHCLYLAELSAAAGSRRPHRPSARLAHAPADAPPPPVGPERIAILINSGGYSSPYQDGIDPHSAPPGQLAVGIACRERETADRFFAELEERRRRLNVYRGKVIDPAVGNGGIHTIGFRAIRPVGDDDLVLPLSVEELVRRAVLDFYAHRDTLEALGIDLKRGILFHGPPGTGKTSVCLRLAGQLPDFTVCFVSGERLMYPREVCRMARYLQPTMLVFEDIDLIAQERTVNGLATVLGELMNQIDGCEPADQVLFVLNTNSLERLEHAVKNRPGRVDQIVAVPLPDREQREKLLRAFARRLRLESDDLSAVLDATDGTTPALLKEIVKRAAVMALERAGVPADGSPPAMSEADLLLAAAQVRALRDPELVPGSFGFREPAR